jgi:chemotaxis protein CheC
MRQLDPLEEDALKEILNIGVGHAADSFSRMVNSPVHLSLPTLKLIYGNSAAVEIAAMELDSGSLVKQSFHGGFTAEGIFLFPGEGSLELVKLLVGKEMPISEMQELEQDALIEVGNILFNSCVAVISDMLGTPFHCGMPSFASGNLREILKGFQSDDDCLLMMNIAFIVEQVKIHGYIMFLMKVDSVEIFLAAIRKYLGLPA